MSDDPSIETDLCGCAWRKKPDGADEQIFTCEHCLQRPDVSRLDAWYDEHFKLGRSPDRVYVSLWMPEDPPHARPDVIHGGCDRPDMVPNAERPIIRVHLGPVEIGSYGDEIEAYLAAALDAVRHARWQAGRIDRNFKRWEADRDE